MVDRELMEEVLTGEFSPAQPSERDIALTALSSIMSSPDSVITGDGVSIDGEMYEDVLEGLKLAESLIDRFCQPNPPSADGRIEATRKPPCAEKKYTAAARELYHKDGEIEIDDEPAVSLGDDPGAYVAAWVWVSNADAGVKPELWAPESHWDDHSDYPTEDWKDEVMNGDTRLSYIDWVNEQLEQTL